MKKILLLLSALCLTFGSLSSCSPSYNAEEIDFSIAHAPIFEDKFYPSLALWNAHQEDPSDLFYSFYMVVPHDGTNVRITLEETEISEETIIQTTLDIADGELGEDYPVGAIMLDAVIKWKYDALSQLDQSGTVTLTGILDIDGNEISRFNHIVKYRPVNECIFSIYDSELEEWERTDEMFAMFVNEDYPVIDEILAEILAKHPSRSFIGTQGTYQDMINQLYWVWEYFAERGTRYSSITESSNVSNNLGLQYVRFIDQTIGNNQANCVDGSALLCSIYRKIGFDVALVMLPGHCKFAVRIPYERDFDGDGAIDDEDGFFFVESTLMGSGGDYVSSFQSAFRVYSDEGFYDLLYNDEITGIIYIDDARSNGYMPIAR